jgi:hypothetical protein
MKARAEAILANALARGESRFWDQSDSVIRFRVRFRQENVHPTYARRLVAALERRTRSQAAARDARPRRSFATRYETGSQCSEVMSKTENGCVHFNRAALAARSPAKKYLSSTRADVIYQNA